VTDLAVQAAETIDSLREQLAEARALVHCGAAEDQRTCSCRRCTQGLAMRMGHRAWAAEERAEKAESALATARREAQEAREAAAALLAAVARVEWSAYQMENDMACCIECGEGHPDHPDGGGHVLTCPLGLALRKVRALGSPEAPRGEYVVVSDTGWMPLPERCPECDYRRGHHKPECSRAVSPEAHDETRPDPEEREP
jgi:hypothetical protein